MQAPVVNMNWTNIWLFIICTQLWVIIFKLYGIAA